MISNRTNCMDTVPGPASAQLREAIACAESSSTNKRIKKPSWKLQLPTEGHVLSSLEPFCLSQLSGLHPTHRWLEEEPKGQVDDSAMVAINFVEGFWLGPSASEGATLGQH